MASSGPTVARTVQPVEPTDPQVAAPTLDVYWPQRQLSGREPFSTRTHTVDTDSPSGSPEDVDRCDGPGMRIQNLGREDRLVRLSKENETSASPRTRPTTPTPRWECPGIPASQGDTTPSCSASFAATDSCIYEGGLSGDAMNVPDPNLRTRPEMLALVRWFDVEVKGRLLNIDAKLNALVERASCGVAGHGVPITRPSRSTGSSCEVCLLRKMLEAKRHHRPSARSANTREPTSSALRGASASKEFGGEAAEATPCQNRSSGNTTPCGRTPRGAFPRNIRAAVCDNPNAETEPHSGLELESQSETRDPTSQLDVTAGYGSDQSNARAMVRMFSCLTACGGEDDRYMTSTREMHRRFGDRFARSDLIDGIWRFLEEPETSRAATMYAQFMPVFITLTVAFSLLQSGDPPVLSGRGAVVAEIAVEAFFLAEVLVRWAVTPRPCLFLFGGYNLIDISTAMPLPIWIWMLVRGASLNPDPAVVLVREALLCVIPSLRLFKMLRHFEKFHLLYHAFELAIEALPVLLYSGSILLLTASGVIYAVERGEQIASFPQALWFVMVTMATVGYGDYTPKTTIGTIMTAILMVCSGLYMAMPLGIVGNAFHRVWDDRDRLLVMARTKKRLSTWGYKAADMQTFFECFSSRGGCVLDFDDFERMIAQMKLGLSKRRVLCLFEMFDDDNSGTIELQDFVAMVFPTFSRESSTSLEPSLREESDEHQRD